VRLAKGREWNAIHLLALVQHSDPEPTNVYKNRPQPNNQTTKQPNNQTTKQPICMIQREIAMVWSDNGNCN
jgi:hypothetical protein